MLRVWFARAGLLGMLMGATLTGMVWQSGPAAASGIVIDEADRLAFRWAERQAAKGAAPAAADAAAGAARYCKGSPAACAGITAATIGAALLLVGTKKWWVPWVENKMNEPVTSSDPSGVRSPCGTLSWDSPGGDPSTANNVGGATSRVAVTGWSTAPSGGCLGKQEATLTCKDGARVWEVKRLSTELTDRNSVNHISAPCYTNADLGNNNNATILAVVWKSYEWDPPNNTSGTANNISWGTPEPVTQATTSVNCQRPDGSQYEVTERAAAVSQGQVQMPACDPGDTVIGVGAEANGRSGTGWKIDLKPKPEDLTNYPQCAPAGASCGYRVLVDGDVCQEGMAGCVDWTRTAKNTPNRVECYYGPYKVDIHYCYWLERAYEDPTPGTPTKIITDDNTDGNPDTWSPPSPSTSPQPSPTPTGSPKPTVTAKPSPTTTVRPAPPGYCATPYNMGPVLPQTAAVANDLGPRFNIQTVGGYRESDPYPDHPSGKAADFMVYGDHFLGERLSAYAQLHAADLGIDYIMWDRHIWSQARASEGWRPVADRGSPTANHEDHVHVTMLDVAGAVPCSGDPGDHPDGESGDCFPSGWGALNPVSWVKQPVQCALRWAFVPSAGAVDEFKSGVSDRASEGTVGTWAAAISDRWGDLEQAATGTRTGTAGIGVKSLTAPRTEAQGFAPTVSDDGGGSGTGGAGTCMGPRVETGVIGQGTGIGPAIYPFSACAEPMKTVAAVCNGLCSFMLAFFGGLRVMGVAGTAFGWVPPLAYSAASTGAFGTGGLVTPDRKLGS